MHLFLIGRHTRSQSLIMLPVTDQLHPGRRRATYGSDASGRSHACHRLTCRRALSTPAAGSLCGDADSNPDGVTPQLPRPARSSTPCPADRRKGRARGRAWCRRTAQPATLAKGNEGSPLARASKSTPDRERKYKVRYHVTLRKETLPPDPPPH